MKFASMLRVGFFALLVSSPLGGCAGLSDAVPLRSTPNGLSPIEAQPTLSVVTTRKPIDDATAEPWFGPERATRMSVAQVQLESPAQAGRFSLAATGLCGLADFSSEYRSQPGPRRGRRAALYPRL